MDLWHWIFTSIKHNSDVLFMALSGFSGAVATSMVEWQGWLDFSRRVVVGALCAIYMTDLAIPLLEYLLTGIRIDPSNAPKLGGFIMGMLGMMIVEFLIRVVRKSDPQNFKRDNTMPESEDFLDEE